MAHQHAALSRVFAYALRHQLVPTNPCRAAELPEPDEVFEPVLLTPT